MKNSVAIILAAGKSRRLKLSFNKVLLSLFNKPLISYPVELLGRNSIPIYIVVGYEMKKVRAVVGKKAKYVRQDKQLGTGHAVLCVLPKLSKKIKNVLVLMGDHSFALSNDIIKALFRIHEEEKSDLTLLTVVTDNIKGYGKINRNSKGEITEIIDGKHDTIGHRGEITPGIYLFKTSFLRIFLPALKKNQQSHEFYLSDLVKMAFENKKKMAYLKSSDPKLAIGVNTMADLKKAEKLMLNR